MLFSFFSKVTITRMACFRVYRDGDDEDSSDSADNFVDATVNNKDDIQFLHGVPVSKEGNLVINQYDYNRTKDKSK